MDKKSIFSIFGLDDFNLSEKLSKTNIKDYVKNHPQVNTMFNKLSDEDKEEVVKSLNALTETFDDMFSTKSEKWTVDDLAGCNVSTETVENDNVKATTIVIEKNTEEDKPVWKKQKKTKQCECGGNDDECPSKKNENTNKKCECDNKVSEPENTTTTNKSLRESMKNDITSETNKVKKMNIRKQLVDSITETRNNIKKETAKSVAETIIKKLYDKDYTVDLSTEAGAIVVEFTDKSFYLANDIKMLVQTEVEKEIGSATITFVSVDNKWTFKVYIVL